MECNHVYVRTHLQGALYCWITTRHGCLYKWAFLLGFMALFSLATLWWGLQIVFTLHRFKVRRVGAHTSDPPWPGPVSLMPPPRLWACIWACPDSLHGPAKGTWSAKQRQQL